MDKQEGIHFLFAIATEIKRSFETPVILVTMKDYADIIYKLMLDMRSVLLQRGTTDPVADSICNFHHVWLQAVSEIEAFRKRIRDTPRDHINRTIDFSIESVKKRMNQFQKYIEQLMPTFSVKETELMRGELDIMLEMHDNLISSLRDKQNTLLTMVDPIEYHNKIVEETEELLNWVDNLNDNLAIQLSKVTSIKIPGLTTDLMNTLQDIVDEVATSSFCDMHACEIVKAYESRTRNLSLLIRHNDKNPDIMEIVEKIRDLEDRTDRLKRENSSAAVLALEHKTVYLEERLISLENLKDAMLALKNSRDVDQSQGNVRIFNHLLPPQGRVQLVEDLVKLWMNALTSNQEEHTSIISILSVADIREVFSDEFGKFTVDKYGRKLYSCDDNITCQLNEKNILVPLTDDDNHVYFYDQCGRYFYNEDNIRVYKAHARASEYFINREGLLLKVKEYVDGKEYWCDELGRYFVNDIGKRIYCDDDGEYYEHDGLGNLVCIRSVEDIDYMECPIEPVVAEDNKYLQRAVGTALKKCIAKVVLCQPSDPILFLAKSLESFRNSQKARQERLAAERELMAEREQRMRDAYQALTAPGSLHSDGEQEVSYEDPNFYNYETVYSEN